MAFNSVVKFAKLTFSLPLIFFVVPSHANEDLVLIENSIKSGYNSVYTVTKNLSNNIKFKSAELEKDLDILDSSILDTPIYEASYPNTVKGVKEIAKIGDYVMLKGYFYTQADELVYEFHDDQEDAVFVEFDSLPDNFSLGEYYLLWARVTKNGKQTFIKGLSLSN